jgi:biotin-dependent carboxylase-like uncharacterized protein
MDLQALRTLNSLLGNPLDAAVMEWALTGGEIDFSDRSAFVIGGAAATARLNDVNITPYRAYRASPGDKLSIESIAKGRFLYLAFSGGIDVPEIMGSRSTYMPGAFGGIEGRRLKSGERLPTLPSQRRRHLVLDSLPSALRPNYEARPIRFVGRGDASEITQGEFSVSSSSDRTGYRLAGQMIFGGASITSTGVCAGTIQLPPGGEPIVLMADAPTVGGYRIVGCVITADLGRLAQLTPGATAVFEEVTVDAAQRALAGEAQRLESIREWALG